MKKFKKISVIDPVQITVAAKKEIQALSTQPITYPKAEAKGEKEIIKRIAGANAVLGSWQTTINFSILNNAPQLKYIGICGSSLANVELKAVKQNSITLTNVINYGDEGVGEYIFAQLLNLYRGFGKHQWKSSACELHGKTIGIVGLGATGQQVARLALGFKMKVLYFSKTRNISWEAKGLTRVSLNKLFKESDIISLHVPKNTKIITKAALNLIGNGKIITDTCLGIVYESFGDVKKWLQRKNNFLIRDHQPQIYEQLGAMERFIYTDGVIAGITMEAKERLSEKVLNNLKRYLRNH